MKINIHEIKMHLKKRGENIEKSPIGSRLKYKRKQLKLTLQEVSENICSVSYLSKIENNMIKATPRYIHALKEKYQMHDEIHENQDYEKQLDKMIEAFFKHEKVDIAHTDYQDYQEYMLTFCSFVINHEFNKTKALLKDMVLFIPNLPIKSLNTLLLFTAYVLNHDLRYSDSKELLDLMIDEDDDQMLYLLKQKYLLDNAFKMKNYTLFNQIYEKYMKKLIEHNYIQEIPMIKLKYSILFDAFDFVNQYLKQNRIQQIKDDTKELIFTSLLKQKKYQQLIQLVKPNLQNTIHLYYYILSHYYLNDIHSIKKILIHFIEEHQLKQEQLIMAMHLKYKYLSNKQEQLDYLRNELLGYKHITDDVEVLYCLMLDAFKMFKKHFYYKEATEVIAMYLPKIKQLMTEK